MSTIKQIINHQIEYYKKGSILVCDELDGMIFYLPLRKSMLKYGSGFSNKSNYLIDKSLSFLQDGMTPYKNDSDLYYLVLEDIIVFNINTYMSLNNYTHPIDLDELEYSYISDLYEDIKNHDLLVEFDHLGISSFNINCIIEEVWSQSMDDWDCYTRYIGVVKDDINLLDMVTDESKKRLKERDSVEFGQYDGIEEYMELYSSKFH